MFITLLVASAAVWALGGLLVVGLCAAAARGDRPSEADPLVSGASS